jgi:pilus assembly protein Flp/PilA
MLNHLRRFVKTEEAATAIEYGLIASLIAVVIVAILSTVGQSLVTTFSSVNAAL